MNYLDWNAALDTGIPEIDDQHRKIVDYINRLAEAKATGNLETVREVLDHLVEYTASHFALEERLQEASGYPHYQAHKSGHDLFVKNVLESRRQLAGGTDVSGALLASLKSWLVYHIKHDDADYVPSVSRHLSRGPAAEGGWLSRLARKFFS